MKRLTVKIKVNGRERAFKRLTDTYWKTTAGKYTYYIRKNGFTGRWALTKERRHPCVSDTHIRNLTEEEIALIVEGGT